MKPTFLFVLIIISNTLFGQIKNIIEPEKTENSVQKNYVNKIVFLDKVIPLEDLKETDFSQTMTFQEDKDFDIRVFLDNSLVNYLHQLDPTLSADELLKKGNYQFNFFVDGKLIYTENLNSGAGTAESKKVKN